MPRAFNEAERERIKARLIEAGKRAINRGGVRSLVVDDVARDAGISKGSFYSFFPSREDFILSVFESWEAHYRGELVRKVAESPGSARDRMAAFFMGAFEMMDKEPGLTSLGPKDIERLTESLPPERVAAHQANDDRALGEAFSDWVGRGLIDAEAAGVMGGIPAAIFAIALHKDDFPSGTYGPTTRLIAEALAMRIAAPEGAEGGSR